ncbi:hypothetical protein, partial [Silanimonas sp.]|uniref:hypothetical protein n=1 Tax=Silanimonas sp. TaxID=1929290 RepID=UPI001BBDF609
MYCAENNQTYCPGRPPRVTPELEARIVQTSLQEKPRAVCRRATCGRDGSEPESLSDVDRDHLPAGMADALTDSHHGLIAGAAFG